MTKKDANETPMMRQHREIKTRYPDAILLFRVGDFYETFGPDAEAAARILNITLTKRSNGAAASVALAGFPYHSLDTYLHKLVKAGHRVAICDQLEDPKTAKGVVKRGVTELVTPGITTNDKLLEVNQNNFLAAVHLTDQISGIAFIDISTGAFFAAEGTIEYIDKLLHSFQPSEIVIAKSKVKQFKELIDNKTYTFGAEDWIFAERYTYDLLTQHLGTQTLKGYGVEELKSAIIAAGAALHYLKDTEHPNLQHITSLQHITENSFLWMDRFTIRNLELLQGSSNQNTHLLQTIDCTLTAMGARLLKRWLVFPLIDIHQISKRHNTVAFLIKEKEAHDQLQLHLKSIGDLERLLGKVSLRKVTPRELLQLSKSLFHLAALKNVIEESQWELLQEWMNVVTPLTALQNRINTTLVDDPPAVIGKGELIRAGISEELDQLKNISRSGKSFLLEIQKKEAENTGISSLKVAYNNVFGYYLEVSHAHKAKVPSDWIRKQTLTQAERYITPELKEYEEKILGAEEKIALLESEIYQQLLLFIEPFIGTIQIQAQAIAQLDCLYSFAALAQRHNYHQPQMVEEPIFKITNGRHPVIEQQLPLGEKYVPNDTYLDPNSHQIIILTGPNMSGKSALLRQTALITLLAHMGSFVPADEAIIGITDKIFTRVGASDNLSAGESTFMVEMNETASIVNNLTARSLVILDEIGRGTSTYDGISIAWSLVEYLHNHVQKPKTFFATHYHELNELESQCERVKNYHVTHKEVGDKIIFLRKMIAGGSRHSFGIQVAKMAGMPRSLIQRAETLLAILEEKNQQANQPTEKLKKMAQTAHLQLHIFDGLSDDLKKVQQVLNDTDINTLTPVEALLKLNELKNIVKQYV